MSKKSLVLLAFLLMTSGCMVGPNYHRPPLSVPMEWRTSVETQDFWGNLQWWEQFQDPVFPELITIALQENKDLRIAAARVQEFIGIYQRTRGDLFPLIEGNSLLGRERVSTQLTPLGPGIRNPDNIYQLFAGGSWEIDLWGKLRRATEAACAELLASAEARKSVIQTLVTAVAIAYIDLLRLDRQLEIAIYTTETRYKALEIFTMRYDAGIISKVVLSQIESEYQDSKATIPAFRQAIEQQENAISILLGRNPGPIPRGKVLGDLVYPNIPCYLPSTILFQRPDIWEAEDLLIAANARIGVARAAYFPTVFLTGEYGNASRDLSSLFTGSAKMWNYFLPVSVPIFTAGRIAGDVRAAEAVKKQALINYERVIQNAFREVEDALIERKETGIQLEIQKKQVDALQEYTTLARLRYDEGYTSYLEVLDAERSLFNVQLEYSETQGNLYNSIVRLYKGLGGGWIKEADEMTY